ncbi:MAG: SagB/ThcOx family dehydrogenase [FCB group bacterium]|nr:SagB/ThcOx family dehydrogenase [FCB group bacterium]
MRKVHTIMLIGMMAAGLLAPQNSYGRSDNDLKPLPPAQRTGGLPIMEALDKRVSTRSFSEADIPEQTLSNLLWAAWGYNRPEEKKRTAPTANNRQEFSVYLSTKDGVFLYDAEAHALIKIASEDIRATTGRQAFVKNAPLNLILVADTKKQSTLTSVYANAGFISQNIYLVCASEGLGTVVRGWFDEDALHKAMGLKEHQKIILCQTVGYPG